MTKLSKPTIVLALGIAVAAAAGVLALRPGPSAGGIPARALVVPPLSMRASIGKTAYDGVCASCHGENAIGTDQGPPFIHPIYNPGHHADEAFFRAVRDGVRAHHWRFGDMPAQPEVDDRKVAAIVAYVRELQRANGIVYQEHRM